MEISNFMPLLKMSLLKDILAPNCLLLPICNYASEVKFLCILQIYQHIVHYYQIFRAVIPGDKLIAVLMTPAC